jgi:glycosyltransferase involved in cell wall biosynthesis
MLSVVIPAYNEEAYLPDTLSALRRELAGVDSEIIVVDNESTDRTAEIARAYGASVVIEAIHNISSVRNTGGRAASGEVIAFLDADTTVRPGLIEKIIGEMADPACLGGSVAVDFAPITRSWWLNYYLRVCLWVGEACRIRFGAMQFCRREAFLASGGYDPTIYVGEDSEFQHRLARLAKEQGKHVAFVELPRVLTSSRRFEKMNLFKLLFLAHPITILFTWRRASLWSDWYENAIR